MWDGFVDLSALLLALKNCGRSRSEEAAARAVEGVEAATVLETVKCRNYLGTGSSRRPQLMKTNGAAGGWALLFLSPLTDGAVLPGRDVSWDEQKGRGSWAPKCALSVVRPAPNVSIHLMCLKTPRGVKNVCSRAQLQPVTSGC